jgi:hypothetical protein
MKQWMMALGCLSIVAARAAEADSLREQASHALRRGVEYFRTHVAVEGTYLWQYSEDLSRREGEGKATATQGWVQPPGTPAVGLAFLEAWQATSNRYYLDAARETAHGLVRGQLQSGGWTYPIDFSPEGRRKAAYRLGGKAGARNTTTFDDDTTQAALRFLARTDQALEFRDTRIHEAIEFALTSVLKAQYPNGAWPQGFDEFPEREKFPVHQASYPEAWPRVWPGSAQYWRRYTLNDNVLTTLVETLFELGRLYADPAAGTNFHHLSGQCRSAAVKAGDFLLLAQMPEPQPAWAQQYDFDMHPAWARKFEPPAVTGGESQGALRTLLRIGDETGESRYLAPIPRALDYLRRSRLPDGQLARFYEVRSNKPLYFTRDYTLTYDDGDMPTHYSFKVADRTESIAREYERIRSLPARGRTPSAKPAPRLTDALRTEVKAIVAAQDDRGRWVEEGRLRYHGTNDPTMHIIRCATFIRHVETLSRYLAAERP